MKINPIIKRSTPYIAIPAFRAKYSPNTCPLHTEHSENCLNCFEHKMAMLEDRKNNFRATINPIMAQVNMVRMFKTCDYSLAL